MSKYGKPPVLLGEFNISLPEVMYYLYLPVLMDDENHFGWSGRFVSVTDHETKSVGKGGSIPIIRLPPALECTRPLIERAIFAQERRFKYVYLSARKGWATPDNPLNRPGWHCDGFGSDDLNFIWWKGPGTRFATGDFGEISEDHRLSMIQFNRKIMDDQLNRQAGFHKENSIKIDQPPPGFLYGLDPYVVHATPVLSVGCMRQFIKISLSDHRYDLYNNSHNYLFDYKWDMVDREEPRNDTKSAQRDYSK